MTRAGMAVLGLALGLCLSCTTEGARDATPEASSTPLTSSYEAPNVQLELVSDVERIQPGVQFRLGVLVTLEPGCFVPSRGPEGTNAEGMSSAIELTMPYDFVAGSMRWPPAAPVQAPDGTTRPGYRGRLLVVSTIQASNVDADIDWPFRADVNLEVCATECRRLRTTLTLLLPHSVSGTRLEDFAHARLFDEWEGRIR